MPKLNIFVRVRVPWAIWAKWKTGKVRRPWTLRLKRLSSIFRVEVRAVFGGSATADVDGSTRGLLRAPGTRAGSTPT